MSAVATMTCSWAWGLAHDPSREAASALNGAALAIAIADTSAWLLPASFAAVHSGGEYPL
jgi:hypothetical protein